MLSVRFLDSETPPCPQINTLLMVMKAIARDLRCMRSLHTPQPQQLSRRLIHFRQKPVTLLYQHGRAIAPIHNSSSFVTSILSATPKRYYASDSLPVQTGDDSSKTVKANASVDGQPDQPGQPNHNDKDQVPAYDLTFTCKKCLSRSTHRVSKQGFYKGTVLITCPGCKNRHLISDHLKVSGSYCLLCNGVNNLSLLAMYFVQF